MSLNQLSLQEFGRLVDGLLGKMGFQTRETKLTADGGVDIIASTENPILQGKYIIQCKRHSNPISEPTLRDLYGVVSVEDANKGILITTSNFTSNAKQFARGKRLELIDGHQLQDLLHDQEMMGEQYLDQQRDSLGRVLSFVGLSVDVLSAPVGKVRKKLSDIDEGLENLGRSYLEKKRYIRYMKYLKSQYIETADTILVVLKKAEQILNHTSSKMSALDELLGKLPNLIKRNLNIYSKAISTVPSTSADTQEELHARFINQVREPLDKFVDFYNRALTLLQTDKKDILDKKEIQFSSRKKVKRGTKVVLDMGLITLGPFTITSSET